MQGLPAGWQQLADEAAKDVEAAFKAIPDERWADILKPLEGVQVNIDREFVEWLKRGEHLNDDFLRGV